MTNKVNEALAAARKHMRQVAQELGHLAPRDGQILRDYTIRYMVVEEVDNEGEPCDYCATVSPDHAHGLITHQVYAVTNGNYERQVSWGTCAGCALASIDEVEDVDTSFAVLIEKVQ